MDKVWGRNKTTELMEQAVKLLGELEGSERVYITGPHTKWLKELEQEFKRAGLVDVKFLTVEEILHGGLRGRRGVLLIDDVRDLSSKQFHALKKEKEWMEAKLRR